MTFESVQVPFKQIGNRRCLTDEQLVEDPYLHQFVKTFANCFERDPVYAIWVYNEPDRPAPERSAS